MRREPSLDQRLFAASPEAKSEPQLVKPMPTAERDRARPSLGPRETLTAPVSAPPRLAAPTKPPNKPERPIPLDAARAERPLTEPSTKSVARFALAEKPWRKDSFLFTDSEFDRLEDLKLELRRRFDLKVTKNDIARVAFHGLFEEYARDPARSAIVRHLRSKKA